MRINLVYAIVPNLSSAFEVWWTKSHVWPAGLCVYVYVLVNIYHLLKVIAKYKNLGMARKIQITSFF